jgi:hypothetical protein
MEASRMDSSSRNFDAWSRRVCRGVVVVAGALSELGDGDSLAVLFGLCHSGIDAGLELSSGIMKFLVDFRPNSESLGKKV